MAIRSRHAGMTMAIAFKMSNGIKMLRGSPCTKLRHIAPYCRIPVEFTPFGRSATWSDDFKCISLPTTSGPAPLCVRHE